MGDLTRRVFVQGLTAMAASGFANLHKRKHRRRGLYAVTYSNTY